jgi:DNA invertase Pin-like site-specific DNA recombinase
MSNTSQSVVQKILSNETYVDPDYVPLPKYQQSATRLTDEDVIEIRTRYAEGDISQSELGRNYGVTQATIWRIVRIKSRSWL